MKTIRTTVALLLAMLLLALLPTCALAEEEEGLGIALSLSSSAVDPGQTVEAQVSLTGYTGEDPIRGIQVDINGFDPALMTISDSGVLVKDSGALSDRVSYNAAAQRVRFTYVRLRGGLPAGQEALFSFSFTMSPDLSVGTEILLPVTVKLQTQSGRTVLEDAFVLIAAPREGQCGTQLGTDGLFWILTEDGSMTIYGSGAMDLFGWDIIEPADYASCRQTAPWSARRGEILDLFVEEGADNISEYAFYGCSNLAEVEMLDSLTTIDSHAFAYCSSLANVLLPSTLTEIQDHAFAGCESLTSLTIPPRVTRIDRCAFQDSGLTEICFRGNAPMFGQDVFQGVTATAYYPEGDDSWTEAVRQNYGGNITWVSYERIPEIVASGECGEGLTWTLDEDGLLTISGTGEMWGQEWGDAPWRDHCGEIRTVLIQDGVTGIGDYAFCNCSELTGVTIPDSVTSIGQGAFCNCSGLTTVTIPASVDCIGQGAFEYCSSLSDIRFEGSAPSFGEDVFLEVSATACYPEGDDSWTEDVRQDYGGTIAWVSYETEPEHIPGDINGDGRVNTADVTLLAKYIKAQGQGVAADPAALDVNGDGRVNTADVTLLAKYIKAQGQGVVIY